MHPSSLMPDLRPNEDVIWHARQHWSLPARRSVAPALLMLATIVTALATDRWRADWPPPWPLLTGGLLIAAAVLALARLLWIYFDWVDDALIITTQRVIMVQKTAIFHESRREVPLNRVQNVTVATDGLLPVWLGYGNLLLEAAGTPPIVALAMPHPDHLRRRIFELQIQQRTQAEQHQRMIDDGMVRAALGLAPTPAAPTPTAPSDPPSPAIQPAPVLVWHRHWWFLVRSSARPAIILTLAGIAAAAATNLPGLRDELAFLLAAALLGLAAIGLAMLAWAILTWREDRYMLDGSRLLDIKRAPFHLSREVKQTTLDRVQDVSYRVPNPLAHLLDYGDVSVETAGETQRFTFDGVAHPRAVHAEIGHRVAALRESEATTRHHQVRDEMLSVLRVYHDLAQPEGSQPFASQSTEEHPPGAPDRLNP